ncbi:hypothetical protein DLS30_00005, partial [Escherichia coli]|nr:hypothetical protein [Escherichia coli]EFO3568296.1 hypothetical protein [Escherichia coli]
FSYMLTVSGSEQVTIARNTSGVILKLSGISPAVYQCIHSTFISQIERVSLEFAGEVVTMKHESYLNVYIRIRSPYLER